MRARLALLIAIAAPAFAQTEGPPAAEAYLRDVLAEAGTDYEQCVPELKLRSAQAPELAKAEPTPPTDVVVALDSSGSMAAKIAGESKLAGAKRAVNQFLAEVSDGARVGLVVYGHKGNNKPDGKAESCQGVETLFPIAWFDRPRLEDAVAQVQATGWTPLAAAIERAGALFAAPAERRRNLLYVVSDGIETCGGDPVAAARDAHVGGTKVVVNVIGFDIAHRHEQDKLRAIAQAGGGSYFQADTVQDLLRVLQQQTQNDLKAASFTARTGITTAANTARTGIATSKLTACTGVLMSKETTAVNVRLNRDSLGHRIDAATANAVRNQLEQRHQAIHHFVDDWTSEANARNETRQSELLDSLDRVLKENRRR